MKFFKIFYHILVLAVLAGVILYTPSKTSEAQAISDRCQVEDREGCLTVEVLTFVNENPDQTKVLFEDFASLLKNGTLTDDPRVFSPLVHEVGMELAFLEIPSETAFSYCPLNFKAGCLHGVVMEYLDESDAADPEVLFSFCDFAKADDFLYANCIHGVGHELAAKLSGDLNEVLRACELPDPSLEHACETGALMEFSTGVHGTGHHTHEPTVGSILLPCEEMLEADQDTCYVSMSNYRQYSPHTESFEETAKTCMNVPEEHQDDCMLGLTEKILASTAGDLAKAKSVCESFPSVLQGNCKLSLDQVKDLESFL